MREAKLDLLKSYSGQVSPFYWAPYCDDRGEQSAHHLRKTMISNYLRDQTAHGL